MITRLIHNWHWKLLSVVLAFILWVVVINYDDPLDKKIFEDVPVTKLNEDAITSQGKAISYLDGETVDLVVEGKRSIIDKMTVQDLTVYADMNRISITNAIAITVDSKSDVTVISKTPNEMLISMEDIKSDLKTVQVRYQGDLAEDYIRLSAIVTPNQIEITGPESKLALVSSVVVPIRIDEASDDITVFVAPQLLDSKGEVIKNLQVSENQIQVKVPIQKIKTVPIKVSTVGEISSNYRLMSVGLSRQSVVIRGEEELLESMTRIDINDVDLTDMTDDMTSFAVSLLNYLPEGIDVYDMEPQVDVLLDIEPIINATRIIEQGDINVRLIPDGLQFKFVEEEPYAIGVKGIYADLQELKVEDLMPKINLIDLEPGVHQVQLEVTVPLDIELTTEEMPLVTIELTETQEEASEEETTASRE